MADLYQYIGNRLRELRQSKGISQEDLAAAMKTTANTISRWETAAYKPSPKDLLALANYFGLSIATFFPAEENPRPETNPRFQALLSATGDLSEREFRDVAEYAQFRRARRALEEAKRRKKTVK
jgi:transcriptional regulator with XRE-family HTH domain